MCMYPVLPPPATPPQDIVDRLTLNGSIPLEYYYVDDSNKGLGTVHVEATPFAIHTYVHFFHSRYSLQVLL